MIQQDGRRHREPVQSVQAALHECAGPAPNDGLMTLIIRAFPNRVPFADRRDSPPAVGLKRPPSGPGVRTLSQRRRIKPIWDSADTTGERRRVAVGLLPRKGQPPRTHVLALLALGAGVRRLRPRNAHAVPGRLSRNQRLARRGSTLARQHRVQRLVSFTWFALPRIATDAARRRLFDALVSAKGIKVKNERTPVRTTRCKDGRGSTRCSVGSSPRAGARSR
jgi:hypothetical protein